MILIGSLVLSGIAALFGRQSDSTRNPPSAAPSIVGAPTQRILDFDEQVEAGRGVIVHAQVYVGPVVRLESQLDSYAAGTLVRVVSYTVSTRRGQITTSSQSGLYFRPLAEHRALGGGGSVPATPVGVEPAWSRGRLTWRIDLSDGLTWGELTRAEQLALTTSWSEAREPDRSKGATSGAVPK